MTNHPKEQTHDEGRKDGKDKHAVDTSSAGPGSQDPDSPAPVLKSEDEELFDEDAPG